jgi:phage I-like protein
MPNDASESRKLYGVCCVAPGVPLLEIMLSPWGKVQSTQGDFVIDDESAREMVLDFQGKKKDIPIDYEHTTEGGRFATASGAAPAAGWITNIVAKPGEGIFGTVKWNDRAREMILADEYRYLSPVILVRKDDRKAVAVTSAALTNTPAIRDMMRVAAKETVMPNENTGTMPADVQTAADALRSLLLSAGESLKDGISVVEVLKNAHGFLSGLIDKTKQAATAEPITAKLAAKLGLDPKAAIEVLVAKIDSLVTERVPAKDYEALAKEVEGLKSAETKRNAETLIAKAVKDGKINPNDEAQVTWAKDLATRPDEFAKWEKIAAKIVPTGIVTTPSKDQYAPDGTRESVILTSKQEYNRERRKLGGVREWAFVNAALGIEGHDLLTADERKACKA